MKVLHSIYQQIWKTQQWPQDWKRSVFTLIPKKAQSPAKLHSSHASKVMFKILQAMLQQYVNRNFQMFKLVLEKAEIKLPKSTESSKKEESFRKTSTSASLTMPKLLIVWITTNCGKFHKLWKILKEMGISDHLTCLLRNLYEGQEANVRTGHGTTDCFQIG